MTANTFETGAGPMGAEPSKQYKPEGIKRANNKIIRRLIKLLTYYPDAQAILRQEQSANVATTIPIPTFDSTSSGGLDMSSEWGNVISAHGGEKSLRVQPPISQDILQEGIYMSYGMMPRLEVRISPKDKPQIIYTNSTTATREAKRIVDRFEAQLVSRREALARLDLESPQSGQDEA